MRVCSFTGQNRHGKPRKFGRNEQNSKRIVHKKEKDVIQLIKTSAAFFMFVLHKTAGMTSSEKMTRRNKGKYKEKSLQENKTRSQVYNEGIRSMNHESL